ncbi:MAG: large subunit ribosomal protein L3 [Parcubacteria group bacterium Gr01-1014_24]|nr:MAG: large subunit ribosomal protein L3 [Parcubacteria group bacterium Gr01-1014_24]
MTQYFSEDGKVIPVTLLQAGPVTVGQIFQKEKDGYDAVQVDFASQKKEFRLKPLDKIDVKKGDVIDVSIFAPGDRLQVSSVSKGKGFQGVVKRHGFHGGPRTHGQKHSEREAGSIGGGLRTHVPKGMRMAGRMGGDRITQKNLTVVSVDKENNIMLVKGAIAGKRGSLVEIISR